MQDALVSIIIPVYNVAQYLGACLDSVLAQTYRETEVVLIDDGSPDSSGAICDEYAARDSRVRVMHKQNGGVSSARNLGLDLARGAYVTFVDGDDTVDPTYVERLVAVAGARDAELAFCGYCKHEQTEDGERITPVAEGLDATVDLTDKDARFAFFARFLRRKHSISTVCWRILFRKDMLVGVRFHPNIRIGEDLLFVLHALLEAKRVACINDPLYRFRYNRASVTNTYRRNYVHGQNLLWSEVKEVFARFDDPRKDALLCAYGAQCCYQLFTNEIKFRRPDKRANMRAIRNSALYRAFTLRAGLRLESAKLRLKYTLVWLAVKLRLA